MLVALLATSFFVDQAIASPVSTRKQFDATLEVTEDTDYGFRNGSFIVAPIPFSNPTIGAGVVLGAGYLFSLDSQSKPSVIAVAALASDNDSKAYGFTLNLYFDNNRWQFESMFGQADLHYDLYTGIGIVPITQDGVLGRVSLSYGMTSEISFGTTMRYLDTKIDVDVPGLPPLPPPYNRFLAAELLNLGVISEWDSRDDTLYPTSGTHWQFEATRGIFLDDSRPDYNKAFLNYTHYRKTGSSGVFVARASTCASSPEAPFYDQCALGGSDSFRGFSITQFLDLRSVSLQAEYRHQLSPRFGGVAFAGVGMVGPHYRELDVGGIHAAVGLGLRYRLSQKYPLDMSLDATHNSLDENQLYIYVGQRF